jgi:hypothetical protein
MNHFEGLFHGINFSLNLIKFRNIGKFELLHSFLSLLLNFINLCQLVFNTLDMAIEIVNLDFVVCDFVSQALVLILQIELLPTAFFILV